MPGPDAARERDGLCDDALRAGPRAPTLCEGWAVRDLLVHLAVRDGRPDVLAGEALGRAVPSLGAHAQRVRSQWLQEPFEALVQRVRSGPPSRSPARWRPVAQVVNGVEFFVHREDVRRAQGGWQPRELTGGESAGLWRAVRLVARTAYRRSPVGVVLVSERGPRAVVRPGAVAVSVRGEPQELLLHAFGRRSHALVEVDGAPDAVRAFAEAFPLGG
ncbi:TIGR03085 family metal-binding protein [Paenibacillus sp. TRM 82003]|uniref:TIGR03085 family metal-binding protein n=1 Tax=Kineococcus sp. TRM81007 TaxID=2925831 RepID=UPI001F5931F3|nr:TIGR03085 family metal-binding protein [Kineococcus sp. TRM81007]MCI2239076.1 TIGR03085 family metal-binding protein [Kineococcus sp. TRM81007]MCI3924495.1 TIGR03085 family metal-binding protein [Paenibacillus sp. TRM 82003]